LQVLFLICFSNTTYGLNVVDDCPFIVSVSRPSIQIFKTVQLLNMGLILSGLGQCFSNYVPRHTSVLGESLFGRRVVEHFMCLDRGCSFSTAKKVPKIDSKGPISSIFIASLQDNRFLILKLNLDSKFVYTKPIII